MNIKEEKEIREHIKYYVNRINEELLKEDFETIDFEKVAGFCYGLRIKLGQKEEASNLCLAQEIENIREASQKNTLNETQNETIVNGEEIKISDSQLKMWE